jgi:SAM-dependent methyltransferase
MKDLFGKAILDFQTNNNPQDIITETTISEKDTMKVDYLFRTFDKMPSIEQKALQLCKGKILDVGCGAGIHSLNLQQNGFDVTSIDISQNAITSCNLCGLQNAKVQNLIDLSNEKFDTILLLMNGTGIFETISKTSTYLLKLKDLLNENGQILIDSSDIIYMYDQNPDGSYQVPANKYYGEIAFTISYKNQTEKPFNWLYLDFNTLQNACTANNLSCELIMEGKHYDYLAKIF